MNYIVLNGVNSNSIKGLLIQELPPISKPSIRAEIETIDGKDGDIVNKLGYSAYEKTLRVGLHGNFNIDEIIGFFNSEGQVIFSNEPNKYYNYTIINQIDFERLIRFREADITLHCQPFKYDINEQQKVLEGTITANEGEIVYLKNTEENGKFDDFKIYGKTSQKQLEGRNLVDFYGYTTFNLTGVSMEYNVESQTFALDGINNNDNSGFITRNPKSKIEAKAGEILYLRFEMLCGEIKGSCRFNIFEDGYANPISFSIANATSSMQMSYTVPADRTYTMFQFNFAKTQFVKTKFKLYVSKINANYEEYCNRLPSPRADNISEVQNVYKMTSLNINKRNLFDFNKYFECSQCVNSTKTLLPNGFRITHTEKLDAWVGTVAWKTAGFLGLNYWAGQIRVKENTLYTLTSSSGFPKCYITYTDENGTPIDFVRFLNVNEFQFTTPPKTKNICLRLGKEFTQEDTLDYFDFTDIQLVEGEKQEYEEYYNIPKDINLGEELFCKNTLPTKTGLTIKTTINKNIIRMHGKSNGSGYFYPQTNSGVQLKKGKYVCYIKLNNGVIFSNNAGMEFSFWPSYDTTGGQSGGQVVRFGTTSIYFWWKKRYMFEITEDCELVFGSYVNNVNYSLSDIEFEVELYEVKNNNFELCQVGDFRDYIYKNENDGKWYKHEEIYRQHYDGDENWADSGAVVGEDYVAFRVPNNNFTNFRSGYCNMARVITNSSEWGNETNRNAPTFCLTENNLYIRVPKTIITETTAQAQINQWKEYLTTNVMIVYTNWDEPREIEITNQDLLEELETIYNTRTFANATNITSNGYDEQPSLYFQTTTVENPIIEITNEGNTTARPTLTIYGDDTIDIYLNGFQVFTINMGNDEYITIDTAKLEASYNGVLKNRQVIGNYENFVLQPGKNEITFTGALKSMTIDNYSRWL